jgi:cupin fold WbuC family metalloprotein
MDFSSPLTSSRTLAFDLSWAKNSFASLSKKHLSDLLDVAQTSEEGIARILAHPHLQSSLHAMLICEIRNSIKRVPKAHMSKNKIYQVIQGEMNVEIYTNEGILKEKLELNDFDNFFCYIQPQVFHLNYPVSEHVIFFEYINGPFQTEEKDRVYLKL